MIVKRIRLRGFRSYADCDLELPGGTVGVVGANGSGKSTLMEAVCFGLFGPEGRSVDPYMQTGEDSLLVELEIQHGEGVYRIRRSAKGSRAALDFDEMDDFGEIADVGWSPLSQGSMKDTQQVLEQTLGVRRDTFLHSSYLRQDGGSSFPKADPRDRREILAAALGLSAYDRAHDQIRAELREIDRKVAELDGRVQVLGEGLEQLPELRDLHASLSVELPALEQTLADAEQQVTDATAAVRALEQAGAAWREQALVVQAADAEVDRTMVAHEQALEAQAQVADLERGLLEAERDEVALEETTYLLDGARKQQALYDEAATRRQGFLDESRRATERWEALVPKRDELERKMDAVSESEAPECDRCGQHLSEVALKTAWSSLNDDRSAVVAEMLDLHARAEVQAQAADAVNVPPAPDPATVAGLEERVAKVKDAPSRVAALRARINAARQQAVGPSDDELDRVNRAAIDAHASLAAIPAPDQKAIAEAEEHANELRWRESMARQVLEQARANLAAGAARVEQLELQAARLATAEVERADLGAEQQTLRVLDEAFGPTGVPAWIVEHNAIPAIEDHANHVLERLGGAVRRVELRTERETKAGATRSTLDVVCHTDDGARDFHTFSGGEQTRTDLALRLGLARFLARTSDVRMLCLDEPAGLDAAGMEALVDVLRDLTVSGLVETVLLASHVPALRDSFDCNLVVTKTDGRSQVVIA